MSSYLVKFFYMNRKFDPYEYQTFELLLNGTNETIENIVLNEIKHFESINKFKIEQYNIYTHLKGASLKNVK